MTRDNELIGVALAAGKGTRMSGDLPKVLHTLAGKPLVLFVTDLMDSLNLDRRIVVTGYRHELVEAVLPGGVGVAYQEQQLGTGHAVQCAAPLFRDSAGTLLLLYGDVPLLRAETLRAMLDEHAATGAAVTMLSARLDDPTGYGRVLRGPGGEVLGIIEHKDASEEQKRITEINTGIYCFRIPDLLRILTRLGNDNAQGEYYITDTVGMLRAEGKTVAALTCEDPVEIQGVNTDADLANLEALYRQRRG
jgi:bifunctional UDP-N-acetylglucosamine pyrophosphorylase/glucosamine-1-phosphate N-acetyltransferase